jgi:hypothetical protein
MAGTSPAMTTICDASAAPYFRQPAIGHSSFAVARSSGHTDL